MNKTQWASLVLMGALTIGPAVAGCSSSGSSGAHAAQSALSAAATSSAVVNAKNQAMTVVVNPCKHQLPGLLAFYHCAVDHLGISGNSDAAKAERGALESCLFEAGRADHVLSHGDQGKQGRQTFEDDGAPDCISQVLLAKNSTASPSPSASKS